MPSIDPFQQLKLVELQAIDIAIAQANYKLANLPEAQEFKRLTGLMADNRLREIAAITEVADRELDVAKAEQDVEAVRLRSSKDQELLNSGAITDSKQLTELQHEVSSLSRRQAELEEIEIEILQQLEDAQKNLDQVRVVMSEISDALTRAETAQTVAVAEIEAERDALQTQRVALASGIDADFLKLYEKIRSDNAGVGAAKLTQGRCDGCRIQLNPVAMAKARTAPSNEVLRCEECRVVLVRTDESGL